VCPPFSDYHLYYQSRRQPSPAHQEVAAKARAHLEGLADLYVTPAREAELIVIFKEATEPNALDRDFSPNVRAGSLAPF